jgi:hypothetical protein
MRRDREDELDLADVEGEVNATTHRSNIASDECTAQALGEL